ncbi:hypothetical protein KNE206_41890 [Kitasatospora sp. NE20-6]
MTHRHAVRHRATPGGPDADRNGPTARRPGGFSWLTAHRRLARDYETGPAHFETMTRWATIGITIRRLTRGRPATRSGPWGPAPTSPHH